MKIRSSNQGKKTAVSTARARRKPAPAAPRVKRPGAKAGAVNRKPAPAVPVLAAAPKVRVPKKYRRVYETLVRLRERVARQISFLATDNLTRSQDDTEVDFRSKEQGTDNFDRDFALNCVSRDQDIIFEIDEALNRIQIKTFGKCESCSRPIEMARLASLPYARMCIACKAKMESGIKGKRLLDAGALYHNSDKAAADAGDEEE